jgi:hypothetical protein
VVRFKKLSKVYANMRLLPYSFSLLNLIFFNKDKIQEFMLCLKSIIHRKILVTMKFQEDVIAKIKMYKILYVKRE